MGRRKGGEGEEDTAVCLLYCEETVLVLVAAACFTTLSYALRKLPS